MKDDGSMWIQYLEWVMHDLTFVIHALCILKCITMGSTMKTNEFFVLTLYSIFETIGKVFLGYVILCCDVIFQFTNTFITFISL